MSEVLILETQVCRSIFMLVIGQLALPLFIRRLADVTQLVTTTLKGSEREHDKEPSGRRDELLFIPERSSLLFSFWLSFLFIFENVHSHLQAAGASRHKGAINSFIGIMTLYCVAVEMMSQL